MTNTLRNTTIAALLGAAISAQAGAQTNGFARTAFEDGLDTLPNLVVNKNIKDVKLSTALDLYGPTNNKGRIFWATAEKKTPCGAVQAGLLPPFFNTAFSHSQQNTLPLIEVDRNLTLNPGIAGVNATCSKKLSNITLTGQAYLGTKSPALSRDFGAENGPGFNAPVYGGGLSLAHKNLEAGWRNTRFEKGPAGTSRDLDYTYAVYNTKLGKVDLKLFGEAAQNTLHAPKGETKSETTSAFAQAVIPASPHWSARLAAGMSNGEGRIDAAALYKAGKWNAQIGAGCNVDTGDCMPALALARSF
jgi:hypothetical protein